MLDADKNKRLYGTNPLFIFDEEDPSNTLPSDTSKNALRIWPQLPEHMQRIFLRAFSRQALREGRGRPSEIEWVRELTRLRSEVVACPLCGNEVYMDNVAPTRCDNPRCGAPIRCGLVASFPLAGYRLPLLDDMRVYRCQTTLVCNQAEALDPLAWVLADEGGRTLRLLNISAEPWKQEVGGKTEVVPPNMASLVQPDMEVHVGQVTVTFERNDQ